MNLSEIRDLIRAEANIEGIGEYSTLIDALINEELQRVTGTAHFAELLTETTLSVAANEQYEFDLPADFQLLDRIIYVPSEASRAFSGPFPLDRGFPRGWLTNTNGRPQFYSRFGSKLRIYPYTESYLNDELSLSYYKKVTLSADTDEFPVDSLLPVVRQYVMGRLLAMTDSKKAMLARQNANTAYIGSRAENAGN